MKVKYAAVFLAVIVFLSCITLTEDKFFFPEKFPALPEKDMCAFVRKNISIDIKSGASIHGIYLKHKNSGDYLIYFYGNGESVYESRKNLDYLSGQYALNVICFDYRGYGQNAGTPSFDSLLSDAEIIYDYVINTYKPRKIYIFSHSIGTVPCALIGSTRKPDGIIMTAPFTNAKEGVSNMTGGLVPPLNLIVKIKAEKNLVNRKPRPVDMIKKFTSPLLILHGEHDNLFPLKLGRKMFEAAGSKEKFFCPLPGTAHADIRLNTDPALRCLNEFFAGQRKQ